MKIAIIGSGPTGLSAAYELSKNGIKVDIYERDKVAGGLAKSIDLWGEQIELGPHFLKENLDSNVQQLLKNILVNDNIIQYERLTRVFVNDMFLGYPPSAKNFMQKLGISKTIAAGLSFTQAKVMPLKKNGSVDTFIKRELGNYLFDHFFKEYTEKLWGIDCSMIDENYGKTMIGFGSLNITSLLKKYFTKSNTSLYAKCLYPYGGMSIIWNRLKNKIEEQGGNFFFSADIKEIVIDGDKLTGIKTANGIYEEYDCIISTVNEMALLNMIEHADKTVIADLSKIKFRSVIAVFFKTEHCNFLEDNCIYLYSKNIRATRITNYNRFRNKTGNDILMIEYWVNDNDELWSYPEQQIMNVIKEDISKLPKGENVNITELKIIKLKNAYPIPLMDLKHIKQQTAAYLKTFKGLVIAGRSNQNNFNYGMEEALAEGIYKAGEILQSIKK